MAPAPVWTLNNTTQTLATQLFFFLGATFLKRFIEHLQNFQET